MFLIKTVNFFYGHTFIFFHAEVQCLISYNVLSLFCHIQVKDKKEKTAVCLECHFRFFPVIAVKSN